MNYEYFIAKRIIGSKSYKSSISAPIIKIGIIAIAIGLLVMLIAIATGTGLQQKIRDKAVAFNGHIIVSNFDSNTADDSEFPISINQEFYPEFKEVDGIKHIQGVATKFGVIRTEVDFEGVTFKGVSSDYDWTYFKEFLVEGKLPLYSNETSNDILISSYISNRLNLKLNDRFQMVFMRGSDSDRPAQRNFTIVGIYNSGFQELDETFVIGDLNHIRQINRWEDDQIGIFELFIENFNDLEKKKQEIYKNTPSLLKTQSVNQKYYAVFEWIKIFDKNIYGIIGIMIIVAGINMITALLVLILERTQMIGVLKALGSTNLSVRKLFLYNASYLVAIGLFWGNLLGLGLLFIQKYFKLFPLNPDTYYVTQVPIYISLDYILLLNIGTFVMCFLMLLIPSYVIAKISPVKAIRFE